MPNDKPPAPDQPICQANLPSWEIGVTDGTSKLEAARIYVSLGLSVLPIRVGEKRPACDHGVHDATRDREQIRTWFADNPDLNLAIATGPVSNLLVVDVDPRNGGNESFERLIAEIGSLDHAPQVFTPSGGKHYYFRFPEGHAPGTKLAEFPGIDFLGAGRYVVAPPSQVNGTHYRWVS